MENCLSGLCLTPFHQTYRRRETFYILYTEYVQCDRLYMPPRRLSTDRRR
jgi:hypothetical protein